MYDGKAWLNYDEVPFTFTVFSFYGFVCLYKVCTNHVLRDVPEIYSYIHAAVFFLWMTLV